MTGGAIGVETYVKPIWLVHNRSTSKYQKTLGRTENLAGTTCLWQIKEPILVINEIALTWIQTPIAPPVMNSFLCIEDGWLRLEKELVSLSSFIEKWHRGEICQKSLALSPVLFLDKCFCLSPMSNLSFTFTCQICQSCFHVRSLCLFYIKSLIFFPCPFIFKSDLPIFFPCIMSVSFPHV